MLAETTPEKDDMPAIRPADILPVSVGHPAAEDGDATGGCIHWVRRRAGRVCVAFSLNIAAELSFVVFRTESADRRGVGTV